MLVYIYGVFVYINGIFVKMYIYVRLSGLIRLIAFVGFVSRLSSVSS